MSSKPVTNAQRTSIQAFPREIVSAPAVTTISNVAGLLISTNRSRRGFVVQNTGTTIIYLVLGSSTPTTTTYHIALKGCTVQNDATGGIYIDDAWVGPVQAISSAPGGTVVLTEIL